MCRNSRSKRNRSGAQQGAALVIALIFLLILTIIGVTSMQSTTLEEKMAGNVRDRELGFQAAEAALRDGEEFLQQTTLPVFAGEITVDDDGDITVNDTGADGLFLWSEGAGRAQTWLQYWADAGNTVLAPDDALDDVAEQPGYVIEELPPELPLAPDEPLADPEFYRVTARGVGGTTDAVVILQATYRR